MEVNEQNNSTSIDNDPFGSVGTPPCENPDVCMEFQADIVDVDPVTSVSIPPCENINTYMYMELQAIFPDGEYYDEELDWKVMMVKMMIWLGQIRMQQVCNKKQWH